MLPIMIDLTIKLSLMSLRGDYPDLDGLDAIKRGYTGNNCLLGKSNNLSVHDNILVYWR